MGTICGVRGGFGGGGVGGRSPRGVIVDVGPVGTAGVTCGDTARGVGGSGGVGVVLTTAHHCGDRWAALTLQAQSCCASHTCGDVQRAAHGCANGSMGGCKQELMDMETGACGCANGSVQVHKGEFMDVQMRAHKHARGSV